MSNSWDNAKGWPSVTFHTPGDDPTSGTDPGTLFIDVKVGDQLAFKFVQINF